VIGLCLLTPARASAHGLDDPAVGIALAVAAGDLAFAVADVAAFAGDARSNAWLIPQAIYTPPQAALCNADAYISRGSLLGVCIFGDQLATFAIYGVAGRGVSTTALYPLSWAIGANIALTNNAVALTLRSKLASTSVATTEIAASVPQLVAASFAVGSARNFPSQRPVLLALGGWSAGLFTHGVMSLVLRHAAPRAYEPKTLDKDEQAGWSLSPSMVAVDRSQAPGFVIYGKF
jgi:hypothetical protein